MRMRLIAVVAIAGGTIFLACGDNSNSLNGGNAPSNGTNPASTDGTGDSDSGGGGGDTTTTSDGSAEQDCVDAINKFRATIGRAPYTRWTAEESCADGQAKDDADTNIVHDDFGKCGEFAQDECPGWPGPPASMIGDCMQAMWNEGPGGGHYDNMSNKDYTMVACGFYTLSDGSVYAVQNFK